jgi:hypothetical protein
MALFNAILDLIFPPSRYGTRSTTKLGVRVRSRAEQKIADYFESIGLRYEYERELTARFWIFTQKISRPDFYLPDYDVYVEFWGMLDVENDYDRKKYERTMRYKMAKYHRRGVKFVSLYPRDLPNLDWIFREKFTELTGKTLPSPPVN